MAVNGLFRRDLAIDALLRSGGKITVAAQLSSLSTRTLSRYMSDPTFINQLQERRQNLLMGAMDILLTNAPDMANILVTVANDPIAPPSAKVSAAARVLTIVRDHRQIDELEKKVMLLEQRTLDGGKAEWSSDNETQGTHQDD